MKLLAALAFILCGTLLILAPACYDYLLSRNIVAILVARSDFNSVTLDQSMHGFYRFVCWFSGVLLLTLAIPAAKAMGTPAKK